MDDSDSDDEHGEAEFPFEWHDSDSDDEHGKAEFPFEWQPGNAQHDWSQRRAYEPYTGQGGHMDDEVKAWIKLPEIPEPLRDTYVVFPFGHDIWMTDVYQEADHNKHREGLNAADYFIKYGAVQLKDVKGLVATYKSETPDWREHGSTWERAEGAAVPDYAESLGEWVRNLDEEEGGGAAGGGAASADGDDLGAAGAAGLKRKRSDTRQKQCTCFK